MHSKLHPPKQDSSTCQKHSLQSFFSSYRELLHRVNVEPVKVRDATSELRHRLWQSCVAKSHQQGLSEGVCRKGKMGLWPRAEQPVPASIGGTTCTAGGRASGRMPKKECMHAVTTEAQSWQPAAAALNAPKQRNSLPSDTRHIQSSHAFKTVLKTHLYKQNHN